MNYVSSDLFSPPLLPLLLFVLLSAFHVRGFLRSLAIGDVCATVSLCAAA